MPQPAACPGILIDPFGHDITGAGQGVLDGFNFFLRIHIVSRNLLRLAAVLLEKCAGQRFESSRTGSHGTGFSLRPVGQVEVFEYRHGLRVQDILPERIGQVSMLLQRFENSLPALVQLCQLLQPVTDGRDVHFIQAAGGLFAVPGDKGNRRAVFQQQGRCLHPGGFQLQLGGNGGDVGIVHVVFAFEGDLKKELFIYAGR